MNEQQPAYIPRHEHIDVKDYQAFEQWVARMRELPIDWIVMENGAELLEQIAADTDTGPGTRELMGSLAAFVRRYARLDKEPDI